MSKFFMYGTSLEEIEQLMMQGPNFSLRRNGIVINNYFNCEGSDAKCNGYEKINRDSCYTDICFHLKEGEADEIKYKELIQNCFKNIKNYTLKDRLQYLTIRFKGELFLNNSHKERFYNELQKQGIHLEDIPPRYIATLFLLTSD